MADLLEKRNPFFVAGGTLSITAGSYIVRSADSVLRNALIAGKFCYVLDSRQMGKSSLCVRMMKQLELDDVKPVFVDLTRLGGTSLSPDQWYAGIALEIGKSIGLRREMVAYWGKNDQVGPLPRLFGAIREVVLEKMSQPVVIFFDEIDATRSLTFSADEFFAAIRECYNRRVLDEAYNRLTFCLLGVAVPSDLIANPASTPFNIGERIHLRDFTRDEVLSLAVGLRRPGRSEALARDLLNRVYYWTNGHPYLTQGICSAISQDPGIGAPRDVDALVDRDLFGPASRESNINLADVANRALHAGALEDKPLRFRADLLSAYERAWTGKRLADDESNRITSALKLSGLMRPEGTNLVVRNRIYLKVFDRRWIKENMPGQELRRLRRAYRLGLARAVLFTGVAVVLLAGLAFVGRRLTDVNQRFALGRIAELNAQYQSYVDSLRAMQEAATHSDGDSLVGLLKKTKGSPFIGPEWNYFYWQVHNTQPDIPFPPKSGSVEITPDGKTALIFDSSQPADRVPQAALYTYPQLRPLSPLPSRPGKPVSELGIFWLAGRWVYVSYSQTHTLQLFDAKSGEMLGEKSFEPLFFKSVSRDSEGNVLLLRLTKIAGGEADTIAIVRPFPLRVVWMHSFKSGTVGHVIATNQGKQVIVPLGSKQSQLEAIAPREYEIIDTTTGNTIDRFTISGGDCNGLGLSPDGRYAVATLWGGGLVIRDVSRKTNIVDNPTQFISTGFRAVQFSNDSRLVKISADGAEYVFDLATRKFIFRESGTGDLSSDGKTLAMVLDGTRVYTLTGRPPDHRKLGDGELPILGTDRKGRPIVMLPNSPRLVDPFTLNPLAPSLRASNSGIRDCSAAKHGYLVRFLDGTSTICRVAGKHALPLQVASTPDKLSIAIIDADQQLVQVFDSTGRLLWSKRPATGTQFWHAEWSFDGGYLAVSSGNKVITIFSGQSGMRLRSLTNEDQTAFTFKFGNRSHRLAWQDEANIHLLNLDTPDPQINLHYRLGVLTFSPDDTRLLTGGGRDNPNYDYALRLWDTRTGQELLRLKPCASKVTSLAFDPVLQKIFATDDQGTIYAYRVADTPE